MRFGCDCGELLSNSQNPNIEYRVYSDKEWIDIVENDNITSPLLVPYPDHTAWICPKCRRLHIWKTGSMERIAVYERIEVKEK